MDLIEIMDQMTANNKICKKCDIAAKHRKESQRNLHHCKTTCEIGLKQLELGNQYAELQKLDRENRFNKKQGDDQLGKRKRDPKAHEKTQKGGACKIVFRAPRKISN